MSSPAPQPAPVGKVAVVCPHCQHEQQESPFAKSTFCRKCGKHYDLGKPAPETREEGPSLLTRIAVLFGHKTHRDVTCFGCGAVQTVSSSAKSSICPQCSAYIDISDFKINTSFSRTVETQGIVHVTSKGDVTSAKIACGEAIIEGKLRGNLLCTGQALIKIQGKLLGALEVTKLVFHRKCEVEIIRPIKAKAVEVAGRVAAVLHVNGTLKIAKKGRLEGKVFAKGITIEKGGEFLGELVIGEPQEDELATINLTSLDPPAPSGPAMPTGSKTARQHDAQGKLKLG